jgi:hypothetical protein
VGRGVEALVFLGFLAAGCGRSELWMSDDPGGSSGTGSGDSGSGAAAGTGGMGAFGGAGFGGAGFGGAGFAGAGFGGAGGAGAGFGGAGSGGAGFGGAGGAGATLGNIPAECGSFAMGPSVGAGPPLCSASRATYSVLFYLRPDHLWDPIKHRPTVALTACHFATSAVLSGTLTPGLFDGIDVLIIMPQLGRVPAEEKDALRAFVSSGRPVLMLVDYASPATASVEIYQDLLDLVGAVHGNTATGPGPTFTSVLRHPITEGIDTFAVYATTTLRGDGYVPLATLGCPVLLAKDTGTSRFVVSGDATPLYGGMEFDMFGNQRLFLQTMEWLVRER